MLHTNQANFRPQIRRNSHNIHYRLFSVQQIREQRPSGRHTADAGASCVIPSAAHSRIEIVSITFVSRSASGPPLSQVCSRVCSKCAANRVLHNGRSGAFGSASSAANRSAPSNGRPVDDCDRRVRPTSSRPRTPGCPERRRRGDRPPLVQHVQHTGACCTRCCTNIRRSISARSIVDRRNGSFNYYSYNNSRYREPSPRAPPSPCTLLSPLLYFADPISTNTGPFVDTGHVIPSSGRTTPRTTRLYMLYMADRCHCRRPPPTIAIADLAPPLDRGLGPARPLALEPRHERRARNI